MFPTCDFQTQLPPGSPVLSGSITAEVQDTGGAPTTIISIKDLWKVCVHWELHGSLARLICGEWCVCLIIESLGNCPDVQLPPHLSCPHFQVYPCGNGIYDICFEIPPGTVTSAQCACVYKVAVSINIFDSCDPHRPAAIAGYCEGPVLQFFDPGP